MIARSIFNMCGWPHRELPDTDYLKSVKLCDSEDNRLSIARSLLVDGSARSANTCPGDFAKPAVSLPG